MSTSSDSGETASRRLAKQSKLRLVGECPSCSRMNGIEAERCQGCGEELPVRDADTINPLEHGVWGFRDRRVSHTLACPPLTPVQLPTSGRLLIGRGEDSDLTLPGELVSRQHAAITIDEGLYYVEDLSSSNGTYLNGEQITGKAAIASGDTLSIGGFRLRYQVQRGQEMSDDELLEELNSRSTVDAEQLARASARSSSSATESEELPDLVGNIGDLYVIQVLEFIVANGLSGRLGLESIDVEGEIAFDAGRIVDAVARRGAQRDEGSAALPVLVALEEGIFTFEERPWRGEVTVEEATSQLLSQL